MLWLLVLRRICFVKCDYVWGQWGGGGGGGGGVVFP